MKTPILLVAIAAGVLAPTALAASAEFSGQGTEDSRIKISFTRQNVEADSVIRPFAAKQIRLKCRSGASYRSRFAVGQTTHSAIDVDDTTGQFSFEASIVEHGSRFKATLSGTFNSEFTSATGQFRYVEDLAGKDSCKSGVQTWTAQLVPG